MEKSRTNAVIKNFSVSLIGQFINQITGFISRTIFIQQLGIIYLGLNGLFSNIFSILSLVELGIGSAIIFSLYKPLAENNTKKIQALMSFYAKAYFIIGTIILILGLSLIPFLPIIIRDDHNIPNFNIIYLLFLLNTVMTYFFAYKRSIFDADQKNYINVININIFTFFAKIVQIVVLIFTQSFILYLLVQFLFTLLSNIEISNRANKNYPYLSYKNKTKILADEFKIIKKNVYSLFMLRIGAVAVNGTDNLLISYFVGLTWVGIYSNYIMLISIVQGIINQVFISMTASVGNLITSQNKDKSNDIFHKIFFLNFILYAFCCICIYNLINPFIKLWIGDEYLLTNIVVFLIIFNIYLMGIRQVLWVFTNAIGLFYHFRFFPFIEVGINLVVSIILLKSIGIAGVFLGTIISTISTYLIAEPYIIHKYYFNKSMIKYFIKYLKYLITLFLIGYSVGFLTSFINDNNWIGFFIKTFLTVLTTSLFLIIIFKKTKEFDYFYQIIRKKIKK